MLKYGTHARLDDDAVLSAYGITKDATLEVTGRMLGGAALAGQSTAEANSFAAESSRQATATAQQSSADPSGATNGRTDGTPFDRATDLGLRMHSPSTAQRQGSRATQSSSQAAGARCQSAPYHVTRSPIALAQAARPHHADCSYFHLCIPAHACAWMVCTMGSGSGSAGRCRGMGRPAAQAGVGNGQRVTGQGCKARGVMFSGSCVRADACLCVCHVRKMFVFCVCRPLR